MSIEYVQQQLGAAERILYTERHHWVFFVAEMIKWILFAAVVLALIILLKVWWLPDASWVWWLLLVFIVPAARIAWGFLSWKMNVYVLTNRRVIESTGVLSKRVADSSLEKLTDIVLKQSIMGRALNYGDIIVLTAAAGAGINDLKQIRRPMEFKTQMLERQGRARAGAGREQLTRPAPAPAGLRRSAPRRAPTGSRRTWGAGCRGSPPRWPRPARVAQSMDPSSSSCTAAPRGGRA